VDTSIDEEKLTAAEPDAGKARRSSAAIAAPAVRVAQRCEAREG
jgi:hypothetical protein